MISTSHILEGTGRMIVLAVGKHCILGLQKKAMCIGDDETGLQRFLSAFAEKVAKIGLYSSLLTFTILIGQFFYSSLCNTYLLE